MVGKEEPISGQSIHHLNGIPFNAINGKTDSFNTKTNLNFPSNDQKLLRTNNCVHNCNALPNNWFKDNSKQELKSAIAMSSFDPSSDHTVIVRQKTKDNTFSEE